MDANTATILSLLDSRLKAVEAAGRADTNAIDDLLARVEALEEHDLDALVNRVDNLEKDVDRVLEDEDY